MKEKTENAKTEMEMTKRDVSTAQELTKCAKNICEWGDMAYAVIHKCLEDPRVEPRQPTEAVWNCYEFPDQETVQLALDYLVSTKRILFVNGEYQMLRKTRFSTGLDRRSCQFQGKDDSDHSSLSASKKKYPFSHVCRYLKVKDSSRRAPTRAESKNVPVKQRCDWIQETLQANNFERQH